MAGSGGGATGVAAAGVQGVSPAGTGDGLGPSATGAKGFGEVLTNAIDNVAAAQATADRLAVDAATGNLTNVHDYMIAATEASLATELTVAVRNKAVEAFNQIMSMGV
jgi:flagellar hook-basal body complex protein FliE